MARPRLSSPDQPFLKRWLLRTYEATASLKLAVWVISGSALVLAWATYLDAQYDFKTAQFAIYGTPWFAALVALLGINVLSAALIRFPWKRYQTGFVVTHFGILVLLAGCLLTRWGGIDVQMPVLEGRFGHRAFESTQRFELAVRRVDDPSARETIHVPFAAGPFSWRDYERLFFFPWALAHRDRGVLYDRDGICLEVLDYLSDSDLIEAPPLRLEFKQGEEDSAGASAAGAWQTLEFTGDAAGRRHELPGGSRVISWIARSQAETDAFLDSRPEVPLGAKGQLVVHAAGEKIVLDLGELAPQKRVRLGSSGMEIELVRLVAEIQAVQLALYAPGEEPSELLAVADAPDVNRADHDRGVYLTYWAPRAIDLLAAQQAAGRSSPAKPIPELAGARIDVLEGADGRLYYRAWKAPRLEAAGVLSEEGTETAVPIGPQRQARVRVAHHRAHAVPGAMLRPVPFQVQKNKEKQGLPRQRRALVRLTVDGRSEEFWLDGIEPSALDLPRRAHEARSVVGDRRRVEITLPSDGFDVGFEVFLHRFERRLDPGTSMPSHYSSLVDLYARPGAARPAEAGEARSVLAQEVLITLNEPKTVVDPATGRSFRLFQESFGGPWKPGDEIFDLAEGAETQREQLFMSTLTLNHDPGRGLKYAGSLLVVAGILTMFYMKAYFFKRRGLA